MLKMKKTCYLWTFYFYQVNEGHLMYTVKQYGATSPVIIQSSVTDGNWHNATVYITGKLFNLFKIASFVLFSVTLC